MTQIMANSRMYLRKFLKYDAVSFYDLNKDKEVLKYTGDTAFQNQEEALEFLNNYPNYERDTYGRWAVCLREGDVFIGWCGLNKSINTGETDLGFRFFRKYWGLGYATEAAKMCLKYGFEILKLSSIIAHVYRENGASIHVLEKCAMKFSKNIVYDGKDAFLYRIKNIEIQIISPKETHPLRAKVLRENIPLPIVFKNDTLADTFHLGAVKYGISEMVGVATFVKMKLPGLKGKQFQLRGMAISATSQGLGIGTLLLLDAVQRLGRMHCEYLWCNAREIALDFYRKQGFEIIGNPFEIEYIGKHYTMFKKI